MRKIRINHFVRFLLFMFVCGGIMGSCATKKEGTSGRKSFSNYTDLERVVENTKWKGSFSSKAKFNIQFGAGSYALSGTLRVKKDEALQISFQVPILGMEAVRIEATPEKILVIDRLHKKYVEESITELSGLSGTGLDYYALQSLLTGAVFRPGLKTFTLSDAEHMTFTKDEQEGTALLKNKEKGLEYQFGMVASDDCLLTSSIRKSTYVCDWNYSGHQEFAGRSFPLKIKASLKGASKDVAFEVELSRFSSASDWSAGASLPSRYEKIQLKDVMKMFSTL